MNCLTKLSLSLILAILSNYTNAQEYRHGLGAQLTTGIFNSVYENEYGQVWDEPEFAYVPGAVYKASVAFDINRDLSFSVAAYPFLGLNRNSLTGGYFGFELPILGEFFFGDIDDFGVFLGTGFNYGIIAHSGYGSGQIFGPTFDGGLQFPLREQIVELKLGYTLGLNNELSKFPDLTVTKDSRSIFSVGLLYMIGY